MSNTDAIEFPQELIDQVLAQMRRMSVSSVFCAVLETAARVPMSKVLPNETACKLLAAYAGNAPYVLLIGKLLDVDGQIMMADVPVDSYEHMAAAVDAVHTALEAKGMTDHTVWLTVSSQPTLISYFKRIMQAATTPDAEERTLH